MTYCEFVLTDGAHPIHRDYHDREYGFPTDSESTLFERLILEINQAGLSWETVLKKRDGFRRAYAEFEPAVVAAFGEKDVERILADPGVIRNRQKIEAAIHNARAVLALPGGELYGWLESHHPLSHPEWVKLFSQTFRFTGPQIVGEFLMSTGYLPGAHEDTCPVHRLTIEQGARWAAHQMAN